jgi:hypothetical protein
MLLLALAAALLSGCNTDGVPPSPLTELANYGSGDSAKASEPAKKPEPPMTRSRAAMECWMKTEKGRADANLDKRADIVTKCIDDKLKSAKVEPKT